jgi:hypothetical protein
MTTMVVPVSHADADHISGVTHLLYDEDMRVHKVYVNGDATKTGGGGGLVWENFAIALADAECRGETAVVGVKRGDKVDFHHQEIELEVLAPSTELVLLGAGSSVDGLSRRALEAADTVVTIPMAGGVDSLNVAAASAVALWALKAG